MKFNWDQSGMPASLVSRKGLRSEFSDFKSVLNTAHDQVLVPVDVEAMARELVEAGGRDFVEMVRELSATLANTRKELEDANRRCERLKAELAKRGFDPEVVSTPSAEPVPAAPEPAPASGRDEWEEWDRKFRSLLG